MTRNEVLIECEFPSSGFSLGQLCLKEAILCIQELNFVSLTWPAPSHVFYQLLISIVLIVLGSVFF